jgi:hypothetical protein
MHEGQFHIDAELVRGLLSEQHPDRASEPVSPVGSTGTVNGEPTSRYPFRWAIHRWIELRPNFARGRALP